MVAQVSSRLYDESVVRVLTVVAQHALGTSMHAAVVDKLSLTSPGHMVIRVLRRITRGSLALRHVDCRRGIAAAIEAVEGLSLQALWNRAAGNLDC